MIFVCIFLCFKRLYASLHSGDDYLCEVISPCSVQSIISKLEDGIVITIIDTKIETKKSFQNFAYLINNTSRFPHCTIEAENQCISSFKSGSFQSLLFSFQNSDLKLRNFIFEDYTLDTVFKCRSCHLTLENCIFRFLQTKKEMLLFDNSTLVCSNVSFIENILEHQFISSKNTIITFSNFSFHRNFIKSLKSCFEFEQSDVSFFQTNFQNNSYSNEILANQRKDFEFIFMNKSRANLTQSLLYQNSFPNLISSSFSTLSLNNISFENNFGILLYLREHSLITCNHSRFSYNSCENIGLIHSYDSVLSFVNIKFNQNFGTSELLILNNSSFSLLKSFIDNSLYDESFANVLESNISINDSFLTNYGSFHFFNSYFNVETSHFESGSIIFKQGNNIYVNSSLFIHSIINLPKDNQIQIKLVKFDEYTTTKLPAIIKRKCLYCEYDAIDSAILLEDSSLKKLLIKVLKVSSFLVFVFWIYKKRKQYYI